MLHRRKRLPFHPNGMLFAAFDAGRRRAPAEREYYSVGGGFVVDEDEVGDRPVVPDDRRPCGTRSPPATSCSQHHPETGLRISDVMLANELSWRTEDEVRAGLLHIWPVMQECVERGSRRQGCCPAG